MSNAPTTTAQGPKDSDSFFSRLQAGFANSRQGDLLLAFGVMGILTILVLPMPKWLLDISLALSLAFSILVLLTVLFIEKPLELSAFPTILLIATVFRLALNLASTRLILSDGHEGPDAAGEVIEAFASFIVSGNYVIGIIIFTILVIVNFVVITKGSGRIAEVSARFSLDSMPGKQMAIDADLSAGLIKEAEAKHRRLTLEQESNFYGAMDGAAKFVRGDAIAGILITLVNIIGGIIIGVVQNNLSFGDATQAYTSLTVGDGLVTQIPALIISTAAGLLVSKAGQEGATDQLLFGQLGGYPRALVISSILMTALSMLPGVPATPFMALSSIAGILAFFSYRKVRAAKSGDSPQASDGVAGATDASGQGPAPAEGAESVAQSLEIDPIRLELGYGLLTLVDQESDSRLSSQIKGLRHQLAQELGFVMPVVRIRDNMQLGASSYVIRIKEIEAAEGEVRPNHHLVMNPKGESIQIPGESTTEPSFGLPAVWCDERHRQAAVSQGYTVVDAPTVLTTHLTETIKENISELLSYAETSKLIGELAGNHKKLAEELIPARVNLGTVQRILQNLLQERISIRDLPTILEGITEACGFTTHVVSMTEHVRSRLARQISFSHLNEEQHLCVVALSPLWEERFLKSLQGDGDERQLAMPPTLLREFVGRFQTEFDRYALGGETPVLLTSPILRPFVRSVIERVRSSIAVVSQNEIHSKVPLKSLGSL